MRTGQFLRALSVDLLQGPLESEHKRTLWLECVTQRFYNPLSITLGASVSFASRHCCGVGEEEGKYRNASKRHRRSKRCASQCVCILTPFLPAHSFSRSAQGRDLFDVRYTRTIARAAMRRSDNGVRS